MAAFFIGFVLLSLCNPAFSIGVFEVGRMVYFKYFNTPHVL